MKDKHKTKDLGGEYSVLQFLLRKNGFIDVQIEGTSMLPKLKNGDKVRVVSAAEYHVGDIIVYRYRGFILIHRIIKMYGRILVCRGDNAFAEEKVIPEDVIGKVKGLYNGGNILNVENAFDHTYEKIMKRVESVTRIASALSEDKIANILRFKACQGLFKSLESVSYAYVKGEALSLQIYGDLGKREYSDIDILISGKDISFVENCLCKNGFTQSIKDRERQVAVLALTHQTVPWEKRIRLGKNDIYTTIDINFDVFWGEYDGERIDINSFIDIEEVAIYGISLRVLKPLNALVHLMLHHYKDMNSLFLLSFKKTIKIEAFEEIYHLLKRNMDDISPTKLLNFCHNIRATEYAYYMLYYTNKVFNDPDLIPYIDALKTKGGMVLLDSFGLNNAERKKWKMDFFSRLSAPCLGKYLSNELTEEERDKICFNFRLMEGI